MNLHTTDIRAAESLLRFLDRHGPVLLLTGAGISTASGIPDYRDADGIRRGRAPIQGPDFRREEAVRKRYWARSMAGWRMLGQAAPNAGHTAIAALEAQGAVSGVVTQNVDGLHGQAGSLKLVELHGNIHRVRCLQCEALHPRAALQRMLEQANPHYAAVNAAPAPDGDALLEPGDLHDFQEPRCPHCQGMLQPDVVFFGDGVPATRKQSADDMLNQAGALLAIGSSLMVHSAYRLCTLAAQSGKPLAALNLGRTRADGLLSLKLNARSEDILPRIAAILGVDFNTQTAP